MEDNVVGEKEKYKAIELSGFDYKSFQKGEREGRRGLKSPIWLSVFE